MISKFSAINLIMGKGGLLLILCLLLVGCSSVLAMRKQALDQVKAATAAPITNQSLPEGNRTWCVALEGAAQTDLQNALDWACGKGGVDCRAIQPGGDCFEPDTLVSHASYAFDVYYQQQNGGKSYVACNFGGTAVVTSTNPSYGKCIYATSGSKSRNHSSAASPFSKYRPTLARWTTAALLLLLCGCTG